ncbi:MAG: VWA domain-containing protein [Lentisphaerae bacterium]|nr:VWA domain-containing protein [Lentisphaerota bacterium]
MTLTLNPMLPVWTIVLAGAALTLGLFHGLRVLLYEKNVPRSWGAGLAALRGMAIVLFLLCLLRPGATYVRSIAQAPDLLVLVDTSRSMGKPNAESSESRLGAALERLQASRAARAFLSQFNIYWFAFDHDARPLARHDLSGLKATGEDTRYAESLATAWNFYRQNKTLESASGLQASRVLLISDGRDRSAQDAVAQARRLGLTVDVLAPPAEDAAHTTPVVNVVGVQSPRRVLLGSESRFLVTVRQQNAVKIPLRLTLAEDGKEILRRDFEFADAETERQISLAYRPVSVGIKRYALQVASRATGAVTAAAPYEVSVKVESRKNEVLLLEDTWRWEFKFLRRVFENDPSFTFTGFLERGPGIYMQFGEPDRRVSLGGFPQTRAELSWFDTFIVGDVNPEHWPKALAPALYDLVVEEGKSLIIVAGPNLSRWRLLGELEGLLPVELSPDSAKPIQGPVAIRISPEGAASPLFFYGGVAEGKRWSELPPLDQIYAALRKKPAATILLEAVGHANAYGPLIVAAEHTVGRGRVLFLGTDSLWKWQMISAPDAEGNTPYNIFWQQTLRALQPGRLAPGNVNLWMQTDRSSYLAGQAVALHFEIRSDRPLERPGLEADVTIPDGHKIPLVLVPHPAHSGQYQSEFQAAASGQYRINAAVMLEGRIAADAESVVDVREPEPESAPGTVNAANLERLAAATGGRRIVPDDPASWMAGAPKVKNMVQQTRTLDFWTGYELLLALIAILGLDWLLRLLRGFA